MFKHTFGLEKSFLFKQYFVQYKYTECDWAADTTYFSPQGQSEQIEILNCSGMQLPVLDVVNFLKVTILNA